MSENTTTTVTHLTAYAVAKAANKALVERGLKEIPPQMVYTYVRKGYIPSTIVDNQSVVSIQDAQDWISKYVAQKLEKAAKAAEVDEVVEDTEELDEELEADAS
jgi:hypothetical protein